MKSIWLKNITFFILQPGVVVGLLPCIIINNAIININFNTNALLFFGILFFLIGLLILLKCIYDFVLKGRGTLSPIDRTQNMISTGLYKYSRNPMYLGVLLIIIGETLIFSTLELILYGIFVFLGFHFFVIFIEEPRLKKDFGNQYLSYCKNVKRWI